MLEDQLFTERQKVAKQPGACQTCHKWPEEELKNRIETIQGRTLEMRNIAMDALIDLIAQIESAKAAGGTDAQLEQARGFQRKAQFLLDFIESENSSGFHAHQKAARILVKSVDYSRRGQGFIRKDANSWQPEHHCSRFLPRFSTRQPGRAVDVGPRRP